MKSFTEYYEEKEIIDEGVLSIILKVLGFGSAGVAGMWALSLIAKGGAKVGRSIIDNFKEAYGTLTKKQIETIKSNIKEIKEDPMYKTQQTEERKIENKYSEEIKAVLDKIDENDQAGAKEEYQKLSTAQKANPEINRLIADKITEKFGVIIWVKTPGSESFQWLRTVVSYQYAKYIAGLNREKMDQLISDE